MNWMCIYYGCCHGYTRIMGTFNLADKKEHEHEKYPTAKCHSVLSDTDKRFRKLDSRRAVSLLLTIMTWRRVTLKAHLEHRSLEKVKMSQANALQRCGWTWWVQLSMQSHQRPLFWSSLNKLIVFEVFNILLPVYLKEKN